MLLSSAWLRVHSYIHLPLPLSLFRNCFTDNTCVVLHTRELGSPLVLATGFQKRQSSSPLSNSHTAGTFISPSMDSLIPYSSRRKGLTWNLRWHASCNSADPSTSLIPTPEEIEKGAGKRAKPPKTSWHHGWRTALFGTCMPPTCPSLSIHHSPEPDFNAFLLLIPVSIALNFTVEKAESISVTSPVCIASAVTDKGCSLHTVSHPSRQVPSPYL